MAEQRLDLEAIFFEARQKPPQERGAYLDQVCGADALLRQRAEQFLSAQGEIGSFLESGAVPLEATIDEPITERPGTIIGAYKLMEQLGEGGMGLVFVAEQQHPVRRKVALKVIKPGMDTRQVVARFEAERQALALMDHPNIAKVHDGGTAPSGRPYFVMELVKGVPITEICDQNQIAVRERLELFLDVCQAVQHAHQKGIIHRDIKPTNVLVVSDDGKPLVKVIDFGVAKAVGQQLTDKTIYTQLTQLVGTPLYMSPEQAGESALDIDTRSDIYSLGVLLYELLTGTTPFDRERFKQAGYEEMRRIIREEEPPRPSTRLSTMGQAASTVSAQRKSEPKKLSQLLRGELDWIVMKALEKDRNRRYETASAFAADVQCYLHDEPVQACPPSTWYRFGKFVRRNRAALLTAAATLAFLILAGAGVWSWQHQQALHRAEKEFHAELARRNVESSLELLPELHRRALWEQAEALLEQADQQLGPDGDAELRVRLAQARRDTAFIKRLDQIQLEKAEVVEGKMNYTGALPKYRAAFLEHGLDILQAEPADLAEPLKASPIRAYLLAALDDWAMSDYPAGRKHILAVSAEATGQQWRRGLHDVWDDGTRLAAIFDAVPVDQRTPAIIHAVGLRLDKLGEDGVRRLEDGLRQYPGDFWLHFALGAIGGKAHADARIGANRAALALRPNTSAVLNNLGGTLREKGRLKDAIAALRQAIHVKKDDAVAHLHLGVVLHDNGQVDDAIEEYREAIRLKKDFAKAYVYLGDALHTKGRFDEGIAACREAIRLEKDVELGRKSDPKREPEPGEEPRVFAVAYLNLGVILDANGQVDDAIAAYREAIRLEQNYAEAHHYLGADLLEKGRLDEGIAELRAAIRLKKDYAEAHSRLGAALLDRGQTDEAIAEVRAAIRLKKNDAEAHNNLGVALRNKGQLDEAIAEFREAIRLKKDDPLAHNNFGHALSDKGQLDEAIAEFREAIRLKKDFATAYYNLGNALRDRGQMEDAITAYGEAIRIKKDFAEAHCNLGDTLRRQGEFRRALEALRRGHELGSRNPQWPYPSAQWVRQCERLVELDRKLPGFLDGKTTPASAYERIELAGLCQVKGLNGAAARFYEKAFAAEPRLADNLGSPDRYNAACAAALAGCGQGQDAAKLDENERAQLRQQALTWLRADLAAWCQFEKKEPNRSRATVQQTLRHWQQDADLAGTRGDRLAKLPQAEQRSWQQFWADVVQALNEIDHQASKGTKKKD
jgi:serine/threonine protein kinase/Flp pilus assembly protein TadD